MTVSNDVTYRLAPRVRNIGLLCGIFCLSAWIWSTYVAATNPDGSFPHPGVAICLFAVIYGTMTLVAAFLLLSFYRYRLHITKSAVRQQGVFSDQTMDFYGVQNAVWKLHPAGGSINLTSSTSRVKIQFGNLEREQRLDVVRRLRDGIPGHSQERWQEFHERYLVISPVRQRRSRSVRLVMLAAQLAFGIMFGFVWLAGLGSRFLGLSIVNFILAGVLAFWTRTESQNAGAQQVPQQ